jgi:hypothetical protein
MELDFDKEIDALLRQTARSEQFAPVNGSNAPAHIDADAISAFAENALPEKTRALYMTHLADCDRCRKILSNVIMLGQNAEVSASSSVTEVIGAVPVPWYRRMLLFPNLAYTMGALVLVFGGLLGYLVLQNSNRMASTEVSQVANKAPAQPEYPAQETVARTANSVAASNSNASVPAGAPNLHGTIGVETTPGPGLAVEEVKTGEDKNISRENPKGPPESTVDKLTERDDGTVLRKAETLSELQNKAANESKPSSVTGGQPAPAAAPPPPPPAKPDARARDESVKDSKDKVKKLSAFGSAASGRRVVDGKTFSRVGSVWYDAAYQGQTTKDVRRGTNEYKKLDSGLRSIADTLGGTVVVVWRDGAYRIQ